MNKIIACLFYIAILSPVQAGLVIKENSIGESIPEEKWNVYLLLGLAARKTPSQST